MLKRVESRVRHYFVDRAIMGGESVTRTNVDPDNFQNTGTVSGLRVINLALGGENETVGSRTSHTGQTSGGSVYRSGANERILCVIGLAEA